MSSPEGGSGKGGAGGAGGPGGANGDGGSGARGADSKREQRDRSYQIDKQIEEDSRKYRKECKILLLGGCCISPPLTDWSGHLFSSSERAGVSASTRE